MFGGVKPLTLSCSKKKKASHVEERFSRYYMSDINNLSLLFCIGISFVWLSV